VTSIDVDAEDFFRGSAYLEDPYPYFDALRSECPVRREPHHGVVHDVLASDTTSYSIHVYSPPLTSMSFYAVTPTGELAPIDEPPGAAGRWT
jgi:hypothetical protein